MMVLSRGAGSPQEDRPLPGFYPAVALGEGRDFPPEADPRLPCLWHWRAGAFGGGYHAMVSPPHFEHC